MRIAFIVDPIESLNPFKDSSIAIMRAAQSAGHTVCSIQQSSLHWSTQHGVCAEASSLVILDESDSEWYVEGELTLGPLHSFDAVIMRKDPPFDMEYVTSTWLLELAEAEGARIFNRPRALRDHSEKLSIAQFPQLTVPTLVTRNGDTIKKFIALHRDAVLKPLDGMGGSEVFRVRNDDANRNVIIETLTRNGQRTIMAQRHIPEITGGDKRILIIDGKPVPYCLARIPAEGETRGNLAAGGHGEARELTPRDREIAETLAPVLAERGLFLIGLDVIGDWLTEINITSPTCMVEIRQQTGFDVAGMFVQALERQCGAVRPAVEDNEES